MFETGGNHIRGVEDEAAVAKGPAIDGPESRMVAGDLSIRIGLDKKAGNSRSGLDLTQRELASCLASGTD